MPGRLDQLKLEAVDLSAKAYEVAFGSCGAIMAAEAGAAGSVGAADQLSDRDKALLGVGALAGATAAISRIDHPFDESLEDTLTRTDYVLDHARATLVMGRSERILFETLPDLTEGQG